MGQSSPATAGQTDWHPAGFPAVWNQTSEVNLSCTFPTGQKIILPLEIRIILPVQLCFQLTHCPVGGQELLEKRLSFLVNCPAALSPDGSAGTKGNRPDRGFSEPT